jgi:uncharacterized protein with HEPN domain
MKKKKEIRSLEDYLSDINKYASKVVIYSQDMTYEIFIENKITRYAVEWCLIVLVEAARQLTKHYPEYAKNNKEPFKQIKSIKKIVGVYSSDIDIKAVWEIANTLVPELVNDNMKDKTRIKD